MARPRKKGTPHKGWKAAARKSKVVAMSNGQKIIDGLKEAIEYTRASKRTTAYQEVADELQEAFNADGWQKIVHVLKGNSITILAALRIAQHSAPGSPVKSQ